MRGVPETIISAIRRRGPGPALAALLILAAPTKGAHARIKKVYVVRESGEVEGEYVLDPTCALDYRDFLRVLPDKALGEGESVAVGEYVFTTLRRGRTALVVLSEGSLAPEDVEWTASLLGATRAEDAPHGASVEGPLPVRAGPDSDRARSKSESHVERLEKELGKIETQLHGEQAKLRSWSDELAAREAQLRQDTQSLDRLRAEAQAQAQANASERDALAKAKKESLALADHVEAAQIEVKKSERFLQKKALDLLEREEKARAREVGVTRREQDVAAQEASLRTRDSSLADSERDVHTLEARLATERAAFQADRVGFEADAKRRQQEHEAQDHALAQREQAFQQAREGFEAAQKEERDRTAKEAQDLAARDQALAQREAAAQTQAREHARRLAELAAREEALRGADRALGEARRELETNRAALDAQVQQLEARAANAREEQARKAAELQQWQSAVESEDAFLKEQKEATETELADLRMSWEGRMARVAQSEEVVR